jgi:fructose-1,6-bisphosphatase
MVATHHGSVARPRHSATLLSMPVTFQQHLDQHHGAELASVLQSIAQASLQIEQRLRTAALSGALGAQGSTNVQGEQQQKLDVLANDLLTEAMRQHPAVAAAISDPLDGSSNIDVNVNVGTIVSVQRVPAGTQPTAAALQAGSAQAAALYVNYGPATMLVYTAGTGTHLFTLSAKGSTCSAWRASPVHNRGRTTPSTKAMPPTFPPTSATTSTPCAAEACPDQNTARATSAHSSQTFTVRCSRVASSCIRPRPRLPPASSVCCTKPIPWPCWWSRQVARL